METTIERIGGRDKVIIKQGSQAFILQCDEPDVEYIKESFDIAIMKFENEILKRQIIHF